MFTNDSQKEINEILKGVISFTTPDPLLILNIFLIVVLTLFVIICTQKQIMSKMKVWIIGSFSVILFIILVNIIRYWSKISVLW